MGLIINAVYENGVLRPVGPLPLDEGQAVQVTVHDIAPYRGPEPKLPPPTPEDEEYARRLNAARTLEEMYEVIDSSPSPFPEGYDLLEALNANRKAMGERPLIPEPEGGQNQ